MEQLLESQTFSRRTGRDNYEIIEEFDWDNTLEKHLFWSSVYYCEDLDTLDKIFNWYCGMEEETVAARPGAAGHLWP